MPVVEIRALPSPGVDVEAVLGAVTREVAGLLGEAPAGTWATWEEIPPGRYSEGGDAPAAQPLATHPPLVRVTGAPGRPPAVVEAIVEAVARILARELGLEPGNVFVRYEEVPRGRLFTGGTLR